VEPTLRGKVILLTGGTEGIGKAAAKALAGMGATLVLTARDRAKGERVVAELGGRARLAADRGTSRRWPTYAPWRRPSGRSTIGWMC
jgi:NAD(P)-dependent dehydrogenase (short-subunit alcohol dehydrogenase family)